MKSQFSAAFALKLLWLASLAAAFVMPSTPAVSATTQTASAEVDQEALRRLAEERRRFQEQEIVPAAPSSYVFNSGQPPRLIWRDLQEALDLGADQPLRVRWFDEELDEVTTPTRPGRWGALVEGTAPNGTPLRRAFTFYCRPPAFLGYFPSELPIELPYQPSPIPAEVWSEHREELSRAARQFVIRSMHDEETGAILFSGLSEIGPLGRPPFSIESAAALHRDYHLKLKLKALGLEEKVQPFQPPRRRAGGPAPVLRQASAGEAGMRAGASAKLAGLCRRWAEDSGEPFTVLVARHGVIVLHQAFGAGVDGRPIPLDYRADVASITKTVSGILFTQFLDQDLVKLDDPLAVVLPDFPAEGPSAITFRHCLTHTSGLQGHGEWGGVNNPHFENVVLNGIDALRPGTASIYTGAGFDLVGKALEIRSGKSFCRIFRDHLFLPLGLGDVPLEQMSSGARLSAWELGVLAQWLINRGSYGELEFISPETFQQLLPEQLSRRYPALDPNLQVYGLGIRWMRNPRPGAPEKSENPDDLIFSPRTLGHGSITQCMLFADLDQELVVVQIRKQGGPRFGEWAARFLITVAEQIDE